ncbi:MAG: class I SAM-dependent methyltransferase [Phycisphaerales bacterium]|nr:class I SAM-dependent methyltransferase [Phycisphaerales bacterium]
MAKQQGPDPTSNSPWFSGTEDFTGYMAVALRLIDRERRRLHVLDLPAGLGQFTDALRARGHTVTPADLNLVRPDYIRADMNGRLPFDDGAFDGAVCLEGIEHLVDPLNLLRELIRVVRPGGLVILSTPNIHNYFSRLQFLFTGTWYQFNPATLRDLPADAQEDRFHISPIAYPWLRHRADLLGADVEAVEGDRWKRKALLPVYALVWALGRPWARRLFFSKKASPWRSRNESMHAHINSRALLLSRTMIAVLRKR